MVKQMDDINVNKLNWSELIYLKQEIEREILYRLATNNIGRTEK